MNLGLTKEDSGRLYGVAILFMLFHHLYCIPERLNCSYFSVIDHIFGPGVEVRIAWICKICVAMYAFVSGYAYFVNCQKNNPLKTSIQSIEALIKKYWLVCIIFLLIGRVRGMIGFRGILDHLLLKTTIFNGEWWYVPFYLKIMICIPVLHEIVGRTEKYFEARSYTILSVVVAGFGVAFLLSCLLGIEQNYMVICVEGYFCARYRLFERVISKISLNKAIRTLQWISVLTVCIALRWKFSFYAGSSAIDMYIIVPFIISLTIGLRDLNWLSQGLSFLGKYSTYIWLTHTFYIYYYFQPFSVVSHNSLVMFLQLIVVSLLTAIVLTEIEGKILELYRKMQCCFKEVQHGKL